MENITQTVKRYANCQKADYGENTGLEKVEQCLGCNSLKDFSFRQALPIIFKKMNITNCIVVN